LKNKFALVLLAALFSTAACLAYGPEDFQKLIERSAKAVADGDKKAADFLMTRYIGLASQDSSGRYGLHDLEALLNLRGLPPRAFLPADWDPEFLRWFETSLYKRWGAEEARVRSEERSFEIGHALERGRYFLTVVAYPQIETWHLLEHGVTTRRLVLFLGSNDRHERPSMVFGRLLRGKPSFQFNVHYLSTHNRPLHHVWTPEFYDLDGDRIPEVWLRYNIVRGNGFAQVLEVHRIHDESSLKLIRRFQGDNGVARRMADGKVETAQALDSKKTGVPFAYDTHHFETWAFEKGQFKPAETFDKPFQFRDLRWKDYFLEPETDEGSLFTTP
jgi:hypothetical protein